MIAIVYIGIKTPMVPPALGWGGCIPGPPIVGRMPGLGPPWNNFKWQLEGKWCFFCQILTDAFHSLSIVLPGRGGVFLPCPPSMAGRGEPLPPPMAGLGEPLSFVAGLNKPRLGFDGSANIAGKRLYSYYLLTDTITHHYHLFSQELVPPQTPKGWISLARASQSNQPQ